MIQGNNWCRVKLVSTSTEMLLEPCKKRQNGNYWLNYMGWTHRHTGMLSLIRIALQTILYTALWAFHRLSLNTLYFWCWICASIQFYHQDLGHGLVLLLLYLHRNLFMSAHLTICHWGRLLIVIISLCRGVASLGIFYILIGQVGRSQGGGRRWEDVLGNGWLGYILFLIGDASKVLWR